jgi:hypothetical protein
MATVEDLRCTQCDGPMYGRGMAIDTYELTYHHLDPSSVGPLTEQVHRFCSPTCLSDFVRENVDRYLVTEH